MKIISCFSYKGGAGRTTLAMNVIPFLAEELNATADKPIILVDMDIDSCGVTYWLGLQNKDVVTYSVQGLFGANGAIRVDSHAQTAQQHALIGSLFPVGESFGLEAGAILCLPANPGASLGVFDESNYSPRKNDNIKRFIEECVNVDCKAIVFDSAVGDQVTASWSNEFSDYIMCCMRPTRQFREGTKRFFDEFDAKKCHGKNVIIIPNVVPENELSITEGNNIREYPSFAREEIIDNFSSNVENEDNNYILDLVQQDNFGVPQLARFMWQEGILKTLSTLTKEEKKAMVKYKQIAEIICSTNN